MGIAAVLCIVLWHRATPNAVAPEPPQTANQANERLIAGTATNNKEAILAQKITPFAEKASLIATNDTTVINDRIRQYIEQANVPLAFYGRFIDQNSNPVPSVKISGGIRHWSANPSVGSTIRYERISDTEGRFEISGETGDGFDIESIGIADYDLSPKQSHTFGAVGGSYNDPVIFRLWKRTEKEQLITGSKFWGIEPDGRIYTIDFLQSQKQEGENLPGDIRISVSRPATVKPRERFDWSFTIEGIQGGILENNDEFMYLAPETGYQPVFTCVISSTNANWKPELDGLQFYMKSRDGKVYGSFQFDLIPKYNAVSVFNVQYRMNPNGSRNLQP